ncbi:hypothetical protein FRB98_008901 [Tulasnella sp. 332]|nr:hypothetical protein FRB98_008901 [Tulasnella sp. 332]
MAPALFFVILAMAALLARAQFTTVLMNDPQISYGFNGQLISGGFHAFTTTQDGEVQYGSYGDTCGGYLAMFNATTSISLAFQGTSVITNLISDQDGGMVQIFIDGAVYAEPSNLQADANAVDQCLITPYMIGGLQPGSHSIELFKPSTGIVFVHSFWFGSPFSSSTSLQATVTDTVLNTGQATVAATATVQPSTLKPSALASIPTSDSESLTQLTPPTPTSIVPPLPSTPTSTSTSAPSSLIPPASFNASTVGVNVPVIAALTAGLIIVIVLGLMSVMLQRRMRDRLAHLSGSRYKPDMETLHDDDKEDNVKKGLNNDYRMIRMGRSRDGEANTNPFNKVPSSRSNSSNPTLESISAAAAAIPSLGYNTLDSATTARHHRPLPASATRIDSFRLPLPSNNDAGPQAQSKLHPKAVAVGPKELVRKPIGTTQPPLLALLRTASPHQSEPWPSKSSRGRNDNQSHMVTDDALCKPTSSRHQKKKQNRMRDPTLQSKIARGLLEQEELSMTPGISATRHRNGDHQPSTREVQYVSDFDASRRFRVGSGSTNMPLFTSPPEVDRESANPPPRYTYQDKFPSS